MVSKNEIYKHYKGGVYVVNCIAYHSETSEPHVVYQLFEGFNNGKFTEDKARIWVKSMTEFESYVELSRTDKVKRFTKLGSYFEGLHKPSE